MNIQSEIEVLIRSYLPYRNEGVPFPAESMLFWCYLLTLQKEARVTGNLLEVGVEHGGTAFLSIASIRGTSETQTLIDIKKSSRFEERFQNLPINVSSRVDFRVVNSTGSELNDVQRSKYRFVHIDAGHDYDDVVSDMRTFANCIEDKGILCLDDVFEIRWPGVTEAVLDEFPKHDLAPIAMVNRKFYFSRKASSDFWQDLIVKHIDDLKQFGDTRWWEVQLRGCKTIAAKIAVPSSLLIMRHGTDS